MGIEAYDKAVERFTWREQRNANGVKILSSVYEQTDDNCAAFAIAAAFEARLRVKDIRSPVPRSKVWLMLKALRTHGVIDESQRGNRYRIRWHEAYHLQDGRQLLRALKDLITNGPLIAVLKISINYHECYESKHVYRFDPTRPLTHQRGDELIVYTRTVCCRFQHNREGALPGVSGLQR
ncbi:hypothetical protein C2845_PM10G15940 [Panicum miliaceum]|uniref:Uncharacterized protein n=1 Tax=Panicum miliaceum TaxID=4540 RepID=A0A3L6PF24_PANMI|nr:hypothetical protein C2845_PM10G15940 [Panicum miliaceum]